jgi:hypothetical protein
MESSRSVEWAMTSFPNAVAQHAEDVALVGKRLGQQTRGTYVKTHAARPWRTHASIGRALYQQLSSAKLTGHLIRLRRPLRFLITKITTISAAKLQHVQRE